MRLYSIWELGPIMRKKHKGITLRTLYWCRDNGLPMVHGKTTPDAVLGFLQQKLGTPAPEPTEGLRRGNGCNARESARLHDRTTASLSNGRARRGDTLRQTSP